MVKLDWKQTEIHIQELFRKFQKFSPHIKDFYNDPYIFGHNQKKSIFRAQEKYRIEKSQTNKAKNMLIRGDNLPVLISLLKEYQEAIQLIYIDPPFFTGGNFDFKIKIGDRKKTGKKRTIIREAYDDRWENGLDSYLDFLYIRLKLMKKLLTKDGSIYVHIDYRTSHYVKIILDKIFGEENFRNEIIWYYPAASSQTRQFFVRSYDTILFYTKTDDYVFNDDPHIYMEYSDRVKKSLKKDEKGLFYYRGGSHDGKKLSRKVYVEKPGIFPRDVWTKIPYIRANTKEYQGFSTQKPERLLKRIILASSNEGDLVADFFSGAGTTIAVAEKLKRKWIGVDINQYSIYLTSKRILDIANSHDILNWNKLYEQHSQPFYIKEADNPPISEQIADEFLKGNKEISKELSPPLLEVEIEKSEEKMKIILTNYEIPYRDQLSSKLTEKIRQWSEYIDFWGIDLNPNGDYFHPSWISYRTHKNREIALESPLLNHDKLEKKKIAIKTVDILGVEMVHDLVF